MDAIRDLQHTKTIIMIAHRLTTVRQCDKIFLLENGELIASGSYEEMMENCSQFRYMAETGGSAEKEKEQQA